MNEKRPDRRRERTRRQLGDALIALILEQGYDSIRIEDIAERADLGRATFYLHFHNKDELLIATLEQVFDELTAQIRGLSPATFHSDAPTAAQIAFRHAAAHRDLYRVMLRSQTAGVLTSKLSDYIAEQVRSQMKRGMAAANIRKPHLPIDVVAQYIATSLLGLIVWWLEHDTPYDAEQMAEMSQQLNRAVAARAFGVEPP